MKLGKTEFYMVRTSPYPSSHFLLLNKQNKYFYLKFINKKRDLFYLSFFNTNYIKPFI